MILVSIQFHESKDLLEEIITISQRATTPKENKKQIRNSEWDLKLQCFLLSSLAMSSKSWEWLVRTCWKNTTTTKTNNKQTGNLPEKNIQTRKGNANLCLIQMRSPETAKQFGWGWGCWKHFFSLFLRQVTLKNTNVHENPKGQGVVLYHM